MSIKKNHLYYIFFTLIAGFIIVQEIKSAFFGFMLLTALLSLFFLNRFTLKSEYYIPVLIFDLLLVSPLIPTGFNIKKYTRLNEILLIIIVSALFIRYALQGRKLVFRENEILLFSIALSLIVSTLFGYLFLNVTQGLNDFYQVFNILLFFLYFRVGCFFDYKKCRDSNAFIILSICILVLNLISISQLFPWGFKNVLPFYMPIGMMESSGYEMLFQNQGTIGRICGTMSSPTSFSIIMVIIILLLVGRILYLPIRKKSARFFVNILLMLSMATLFLTYSRSGFFALIVSLAFLLGKAHCRDKKAVIRFLIQYTLLICLLLSSIFLLKNPLGTPIGPMRGFRLAHLISPQEESSYEVHGEKVSDIGNRIELAKLGLIKAMYSPILGWGAVNAASLEAKQKGLGNTVETFFGSHNEYIEIIIKQGLIGLILLLSFFICVFRRASRIAKLQSNGFQLFIARSVQAIIVAIAIFSLSDGFWYNNVIPPMLMLIIGAMYASEKTCSSAKTYL